MSPDFLMEREERTEQTPLYEQHSRGASQWWRLLFFIRASRASEMSGGQDRHDRLQDGLVRARTTIYHEAVTLMGVGKILCS